MLALAEAWLHPFPSPWRLHWQQQQEAVLRTPAGSRLAVLAVFSLLLIDGHAQVLLQQRQPSATRERSKTVTIQCNVEGIDDFQAAYIHWYRQMPAKAPERLLYVTAVAQVSYDSDSYKNKYLSYKSENNVCTLSVQDIGDDDKGTYYCAYRESHRGSRL